MAEIEWFSDDPTHKYYAKNPLYKHYEDDVWGIPPHNDRNIFEQYIIGMFAAGLNWHASFIKYPHLTKVFHDWDIEKIAQMNDEDVERLLQDKGVIRNRRKLKAVIWNAKVAVKIQKEYGSLDNYFWSQVAYKQERRNVKKLAELGATSEKGDALARQMKKDGFKYAGPVSIWSFMNSIGLVSSRIDRKGIEANPKEYIKKLSEQGSNTFNL
ncbi:DNA-3-methyladenine glycosylase I [uncultured Lactobacillus sp.]|uniref:DNA-3-methyladenine glycosylase I n=1 Tax=uncultured Lactobacillus sp. TaxID=153152 RepID=UPI002803D934|nr:DNA-3-methyladenine glycosylase I [uncultured Lactobacillus sp.]